MNMRTANGVVCLCVHIVHKIQWFEHTRCEPFTGTHTPQLYMCAQYKSKEMCCSAVVKEEVCVGMLSGLDGPLCGACVHICSSHT